MRIKLGAKVKTEDGKSIGEVDRVVIDPSDEEITQIVVKKGVFFTEDKLIPISMLGSVGESEVQLRASEHEIEEMPDFETMMYLNYDEMTEVDRDQVGYAARLIMYPPSGVMNMPVGLRNIPPVITRVKQNIPAESVAIVDGADVMGLEGKKVGEVDEIIMNPELDRATYFVITKGFLLKEKKLVPVEWVKTMEDGKIQLIVDEKIIQQLPKYPRGEF
jgi:uncharacterized protein YrrD